MILRRTKDLNKLRQFTEQLLCSRHLTYIINNLNNLHKGDFIILK